MNWTENKKTVVAECEIRDDLKTEDLSRHELTKVYAVERTFTKVSFKQTVFSSCYLRKCRFVECDFTGAAFKECNLRGAVFEGCKFDYCSWEKTQIEIEFLETCLPTGENLARDVVRSLRVNFAQIGDYEGVNAAIRAEVRLTREHYYNAGYSKISYYRAKYKGWKRWASKFTHAKWKLLDLLWGNGESIFRVSVVAALTILLLAFAHPHTDSATGYVEAIPRVFMNFWGVAGSEPLPPSWFAVITAIRFLLFGLFMAILVKRLARR